MRQLTSKQKKLLDKVSDERKELGFKTLSIDDLPDGVFQKLEEINDTEILWQEVNSYLWDRNF